MGVVIAVEDPGQGGHAQMWALWRRLDSVKMDALEICSLGKEAIQHLRGGESRRRVRRLLGEPGLHFHKVS